MGLRISSNRGAQQLSWGTGMRGHQHGGNVSDAFEFSDESRFTWEYVDNLRRFAKTQGTLDKEHVQRLLAALEAETRLRHGEKP